MDTEIARIDEWLRATGTKEARLGLLACANAKALERVRDGTARINTLRELLDYIALHPPKTERRR